MADVMGAGGPARPGLADQRGFEVGKFISERCYCAMDDSLHLNLCITNAHKLIHLSELH